MFKHLLVPTDGSELSLKTAKRAVAFAKEINARITFLYAEPSHPVSFFGNAALTDPEFRERTIKTDDKRAEEILGAVKAEATAAGVDASSVVKISDQPYEAIIATAQDRACDLIFMASHGRRGISGLLLGSETNKVLTHTNIPVLVYR